MMSNRSTRRPSRTSRPVAAAAVAALMTASLVGCSNSQKSKAAAPTDPEALAKLKAEQERREQQRDHARREFEQAKADTLAARQEAARLRAEAEKLTQTAATDLRQAERCRQKADVLERDGRTIILAGRAREEMNDYRTGPDTIERGESKITWAGQLRDLAGTLTTGAAEKRDHAESLNQRADEQLDKARERHADAQQFASMLASFASLD